MKTPQFDRELIQKYNVAGPRYTSYPTAPEWSMEIGSSVYADKLRAFKATDKTLSLYIHIPYCESLCYFCACNKVIRKNLSRYGDNYIDYLEKEIRLVTDIAGKGRSVRQYHWGGGTPTFLTESQIERLFNIVAEHFTIDSEAEISIELDPRTIEESKIRTLKRLGFNRVSMGVQDYDPQVQEAVNRIQPYDLVRDVYRSCRANNFVSVNMDLIYGLPYQTCQSFRQTVDQTIQLAPDRVALYSFAHVPWLITHQKHLQAETLPGADAKLDIFLQAREQFESAGYVAIAMDHFALPTDEMAQAFSLGALHRNFMGYTLKPSDDFIGLGVSAIGFLEKTFIQNQKTVESYCQALDGGILPTERGLALSSDDCLRQWVINSLMCRFHIDKKLCADLFQIAFDEYFSEEQTHLSLCARDGLLVEDAEAIRVTELGRNFIRNICMGFDWYLRQAKAHKRFSKTV